MQLMGDLALGNSILKVNKLPVKIKTSMQNDLFLRSNGSMAIVSGYSTCKEKV